MSGSWRTTVSGIAGAVGLGLTGIAGLGSVPPWVGIAGTFLTMFAMGLMGVTSRDNKVSSIDVGIVKPVDR